MLFRSHFADYTMNQGSLFTAEIGYDEEPAASDSALLSALKGINLDECTPMQALIHLSKLKEMAEQDS